MQKRKDSQLLTEGDGPSSMGGQHEASITSLVVVCCSRFLDYVRCPVHVDSPLPSYSRSKFNTLDASTGLLIGGGGNTRAGGNNIGWWDCTALWRGGDGQEKGRKRHLTEAWRKKPCDGFNGPHRHSKAVPMLAVKPL